MTESTWETEHDLLALWRQALSPPLCQVLELVSGIGQPEGALTYHDAATRLHVSIATIKRRRLAALTTLRHSSAAPAIHAVLTGAAPHQRHLGRCHVVQGPDAALDDRSS